jgi:hypothetical protein
MCDKSCPRQPAMLGLLSLGYFPSSPVKPKFAIKQNLLELFQNMNMKGPSSKHTYCYALLKLLRRNSHPSIFIPEMYKPFLSIYSAWLDVQFQLEVKFEHLISSIPSEATSSLNPTTIDGEANPFSLDTSMSEAPTTVTATPIDNENSTIATATIDNEDLTIANTTMDTESSTIATATIDHQDYIAPNIDAVANELSPLPLSLNPTSISTNKATPVNVKSIWTSYCKQNAGPIPLRERCRACFGDDPSSHCGYISFDGNFQHRRFSTRPNNPSQDVNSRRELTDQRLFIPTLSADEVPSFQC